MTKILATIHKPQGDDVSIGISTRAVFGTITFVGSNPIMLSHLKDGDKVELKIKPFKKS